MVPSPADRALEYAAGLAQSEGASLHIVHIVEKFAGSRARGQDQRADEPELDDRIHDQADRLRRETGLEVHVQMSPTSGSVAKKIAEIAKRKSVDLIVVGTRGRSAVTGAVLEASPLRRSTSLTHRRNPPCRRSDNHGPPRKASTSSRRRADNRRTTSALHMTATPMNPIDRFATGTPGLLTSTDSRVAAVHARGQASLLTEVARMQSQASTAGQRQCAAAQESRSR